MLSSIHTNNRLQLIIGLITGVFFGFLLQKGGVADFDIIVNQLLLEDFTVIKIMLSAVIVGMIGVHAMKQFGLVEINPKSGSVGKTIFGGLLFGIGFATLGYCPGTVMAAAGQGSLDAIAGGIPGIMIGSSILAAIYPKLQDGIFRFGDFGNITLPELLKINIWAVVIPFALILTAILSLIEKAGL